MDLIHAYIYIYIYVYICIYMYIYIYIYILNPDPLDLVLMLIVCYSDWVLLRLSLSIPRNACVCECMHACMHVCVYMCMHTLWIWFCLYVTQTQSQTESESVFRFYPILHVYMVNHYWVVQEKRILTLGIWVCVCECIRFCFWIS